MLISHSVWYSRENAGTELSCEGVTSSVVRSLSPLLPPPISTAPAGVLQLLWPFRASLRIANEGYFAVIFTISSLTFFHFHLHLRMCDCWVQAPSAKESQVVAAVEAALAALAVLESDRGHQRQGAGERTARLWNNLQWPQTGASPANSSTD